MAVPTDQEYSIQGLIEINTAFLALLEVNGSSGCTVKLYDSSDTLLSTIALDNPPGTVDGGTGVLTLDSSTPDSSPTAGAAAYCEVHDAIATWATRMPCVESGVAVSRSLALSTLTIVGGATLSITTMTIG